MEAVNQKYSITATAVSPVSIGQGGEKDWVEGIDYIRKDDVLYHLNLKMMAEAGIPMDKLSALFASWRTDAIRDFLERQLEDIHDFALEMPVGSSNPVKTFHFNSVTGYYTLFGSSLKGAIRSALFHALTRSSDKEELTEKRGSLNEYVFGKMKDGTDVMRFIRVGDVDFAETGLVNTKIYNLQRDGAGWIGGWKHDRQRTDTHFDPVGFNTVYECLMPGEKSREGFIMISPLLFEKVTVPMNFRTEKQHLLSGKPIRNLFQWINEATQTYLEKEIRFFEAYPQGEHSDRILSALYRYQASVAAFIRSGNTECLIKMSAGTGFHSITGDWQYRDYTDTGYDFKTGKKRFKSRKIACFDGHFTPMGFLKLTALP